MALAGLSKAGVPRAPQLLTDWDGLATQTPEGDERIVVLIPFGP